MRHFFTRHFPDRIPFFGLLLLLTAAILPQAANANDLRCPLSLGVFAYLGQEETRAIYTPLVDYLNRILTDERIVLHVLSQEEIYRGVADGKLDIATPSTQHMGGYRAQAYTLYKQGIVLPEDAASVRAVETDQAVIKALRSGEAEVGFVREGVLEMLAERGEIQLVDFRVIHLQKHPTFPFLAST